jgi:hypothetical protein
MHEVKWICAECCVLSEYMDLVHGFTLDSLQLCQSVDLLVVSVQPIIRLYLHYVGYIHIINTIILRLTVQI